MDNDNKMLVITFLGFALLFLIVVAAIISCHEIIENGNAQRCAEFSYKCGGEDEQRN